LIGVNAAAPYGARPPAPRGSIAGDGLSDWSTPTAVRSSAAAVQQSEIAYDPRPSREPEFGGEAPVERGLPGWVALVVLLIIAGIGGLIDTLSGGQARGGFNYGVVIASIVAILVVRRSGMFPIVIAPPIVYSLASGGMLYIRSGGLHDKRVLFDGAANWLVYGFPAIASATAGVLIIAGIRMIIRR
jgi:hypothetical protein